MTKTVGSGSESGSISQRHGSADPDPHQNVTDPEYWSKQLFAEKELRGHRPSVCERFIYSHDQSAFSVFRKYVDRSWENINRSQTHMNVEIGTDAPAIPRKGIHKWDFRCSSTILFSLLSFLLLQPSKCHTFLLLINLAFVFNWEHILIKLRRKISRCLNHIRIVAATNSMRIVIYCSYVTSFVGYVRYFFFFFSFYIQHYFICRPSDSTVPTDAGIEPRTIATGALAVRHSNH